MEKTITALELRRAQAQQFHNEQELRDAFQHMPKAEQVKYFKMFDNKSITSPDTYIAWLKEMKIL